MILTTIDSFCTMTTSGEITIGTDKATTKRRKTRKFKNKKINVKFYFKLRARRL